MPLDFGQMFHDYAEKNKKKFINLLENIRDIKILYPQITQIIPTIKD